MSARLPFAFHGRFHRYYHAALLCFLGEIAFLSTSPQNKDAWNRHGTRSGSGADRKNNSLGTLKPGAEAKVSSREQIFKKQDLTRVREKTPRAPRGGEVREDTALAAGRGRLLLTRVVGVACPCTV